MRQWKSVVVIIAVFAAGWTLGAARPPAAEARARAKPVACADDLKRTRQQLSASQAETKAAQAEAAAARADAAAARAERDAVVERERERVKRLQGQLGAPIEKLE